MMGNSKYFNNNKPVKQYVKNRRDADKLVIASHRASSIIYMWVLHDKFGFGGKRLGRLTEEYHNVLDSIQKGYLKIEDLNETLYEETGTKVI